MRWFFRLVLLLGLVALAAAGVAGWAWWTLHQPHAGLREEVVVVVPPGRGASAILDQLAEAGVVTDSRLARLYLVYWLGDPPLRAGEYRFTPPLSTPQALAKLIRGEVVTYPVTLIEGLVLDEIADVLAVKGFGDPEVLRREMRRRTDLVTDLDPQAPDLEGYLYPDTYSFARGTSEETIVATLVETFRRRFQNEVAPLLAGGTAPPAVRELVTLASIVEKEARLDSERPLVASVYTNRLERGIALYADPTVIYALRQKGTWDGNLRRPDLEIDSPYNTYRYPGLPPGPICSPGVQSLIAAASPAETPYLYFVSRNNGSHVFAETLGEHNRNVERWQRRYWRERWAEERQRRK